MSKRISVTLPDKINDKLQRWADNEGRTLANLCNFILEKAVRDADEKGDIPPEKVGR